MAFKNIIELLRSEKLKRMQYEVWSIPIQVGFRKFSSYLSSFPQETFKRI